MEDKLQTINIVFTNEGMEMSNNELLEFVTKEIEAISEDFERNIQEQILFCKFLKITLDVAKGIQPAEDLNEIKKSML